MKKLLIYPTSRALRSVSKELKKSNGFLPTLMRMDEFEHRAVLLPGKAMVDPLQRILLLRKAADFNTFGDLKVNRDLIHFFTKSDSLFKFFEELAQENVSFTTLSEADAYAEFASHLDILENLLENYRILLEKDDLTDKAFIPENYRLNEGFLQGYEHIEIYLEGYLSHFELELIGRISEKKDLLIHMATSRFNQKMQERFESYGIKLPNDSMVSIDFGNRKIIETYPNPHTINANVHSVEERYEQISLAFEKIDDMVRSGISPENIALILPDEGIKKAFELYDKHSNLNFAMGFDYIAGEAYKKLEILYRYWQHFDKESRYLLERYGLEAERISGYSLGKKIRVEDFFRLLHELSLLDCPLEADGNMGILEEGNDKVYEKYLHFLKIFENLMLSAKDWLFIWMKSLSEITLDDIRGGLVTVMGVLETRGVSFDGVVIVDFNDGIVPASSSKDQFLNSSVRAFANLPTLSDREALQKQYYKRLLEQAETACIIYSGSENRLPSKFLYELGLERAERSRPDLSLLYSESSHRIDLQDPLVRDFDPASIVWSSSRLKTFLECKRKYYYRYIQKIQAKEDEEINEGAFLHTMLDHLYREKSSYHSVDEMQNSINRLLDSLLPESDAKIGYHKLLWKEKLKGFVQSEVAHFEKGWLVAEREFEAAGEIEGLRFKGRIDRIDSSDTDTLVIDYKSGSTKEANRSKNLDKLTDFQMSIYSHILPGRYQGGELAFMKIFEGGKLEYITGLEEKNKLLSERIEELKETRSIKAERCEDLSKCKYCEFALMCERGEYL